MSVLIRVRKSLVEQGPSRTLQTAVTILGDRWFNWRYGTDTAQEVWLGDLDVPQPEEGALDYQASRTFYFRGLLRRVAAPRGGVFVDLGAGKCRTLLIAAQHGYRKAIGVEFSEALCVTARRNIEAFRRRTPVQTELLAVKADVAEYPIVDDQNVFYVTAFAEPALRRVLDNVVESVKRAPRDITLISHNPYCPEVIERHGALTKVDHSVFGSQSAMIFQESRRGLTGFAASRLAHATFSRTSSGERRWSKQAGRQWTEARCKAYTLSNRSSAHSAWVDPKGRRVTSPPPVVIA